MYVVGSIYVVDRMYVAGSLKHRPGSRELHNVSCYRHKKANSWMKEESEPKYLQGDAGSSTLLW